MASFVRSESIVSLNCPKDCEVIDIPRCYYTRWAGENNMKEDLIILENLYPQVIQYIINSYWFNKSNCLGKSMFFATLMTILRRNNHFISPPWLTPEDSPCQQIWKCRTGSSIESDLNQICRACITSARINFCSNSGTSVTILWGYNVPQSTNIFPLGDRHCCYTM